MTIEELQFVRNALNAVDDHARFSGISDKMREDNEHALRLLEQEIENSIEYQQRQAS